MLTQITSAQMSVGMIYKYYNINEYKYVIYNKK